MPGRHTFLKQLFRPLRTWVCLALCALFVGCGEEQLEFTETKRINEKVTEAELQTFLRIVESLPDQQLPDVPPVFAPPPVWNQSRTLPVGELVNEEQNLLAERWTAEWMARHLQRNRPLARALRREEMTLEQFVGFTLAIGAALARNTIRDNQDLDEILKKGHAAVERLRRDTRPFSSLRQDGRYYILWQAEWITRIDRVERLKQVPPENIALVRAHREKLEEIFPAEFATNPLDAVVDLLEEKGLPFEELAGSGSDAEIDWEADEAIVGTDPPDEEFLDQPPTAGAATTPFSGTN